MLFFSAKAGTDVQGDWALHDVPLCGTLCDVMISAHDVTIITLIAYAKLHWFWSYIKSPAIYWLTLIYLFLLDPKKRKKKKFWSLSDIELISAYILNVSYTILHIAYEVLWYKIALCSSFLLLSWGCAKKEYLVINMGYLFLLFLHKYICCGYWLEVLTACFSGENPKWRKSS